MTTKVLFPKDDTQAYVIWVIALIISIMLVLAFFPSANEATPQTESASTYVNQVMAYVAQTLAQR